MRLRHFSNKNALRRQKIDDCAITNVFLRKTVEGGVKRAWSVTCSDDVARDNACFLQDVETELGAARELARVRHRNIRELGRKHCAFAEGLTLVLQGKCKVLRLCVLMRGDLHTDRVVAFLVELPSFDVYLAAHVHSARLPIGELKLTVAVRRVGKRNELVEHAVLVQDGVVEVHQQAVHVHSERMTVLIYARCLLRWICARADFFAICLV